MPVYQIKPGRNRYVLFSGAGKTVGCRVQAPLIEPILISSDIIFRNLFFDPDDFGMIGLGIVSVLFTSMPDIEKITEKRFFDVAVFLILCSLWCILDSGFIRCMENRECCRSTGFLYAFMLMSVPILHFIQDTVSKK